MPIFARNPNSDFVPCPAGTHAAVCVDVVDLGEQPDQYKGGTRWKVKLVWQVAARMTDGRPFMVSRTYTNSLHEKAALRKDLAAWRGRDFSDDELRNFDLEKLLGAPAYLSVLNEHGDDGTMYSNIAAIMRLPQGSPVPQPEAYTRVKDREQQGQQQQPRRFAGPQALPRSYAPSPEVLQARNWATTPPQPHTTYNPAPSFNAQTAAQMPPPPPPLEDDIPF